jgi:hypothetical protein
VNRGAQVVDTTGELSGNYLASDTIIAHFIKPLDIY